MNNKSIQRSSGRYHITGPIDNLTIKVVLKEFLNFKYNFFETKFKTWESQYKINAEKEFSWKTCYENDDKSMPLYCQICRIMNNYEKNKKIKSRGDDNINVADEGITKRGKTSKGDNILFSMFCCEHYALELHNNLYANKKKTYDRDLTNRIKFDENIIHHRYSDIIPKKIFNSSFGKRKEKYDKNSIYNVKNKNLLIFANFDKNPTYENVELLMMIKFDPKLNILNVYPDFHKFETEAGYTFNDSKEKHNFQFWIFSNHPNIRSLISENSMKTIKFDIINKTLECTVPVINIFGQIKLAESIKSSPDRIFIRYIIAIPNEWSTSSSNASDVTNTSYLKNNCFNINHTFEYEFRINDRKYNFLPYIFFEVVSLKYGGKLTHEGFGKLNIPLKPGLNLINVPIDRIIVPQMKNYLKSEFTRSLICWYDLQEPKLLCELTNNILGFKTEPNGHVVFEISSVISKKKISKNDLKENNLLKSKEIRMEKEVDYYLHQNFILYTPQKDKPKERKMY